MDGAVVTWLESTVNPDQDPAVTLAQGQALMRAQPVMPKVFAGDVHCRLAALSYWVSDWGGSARHGAHATRIALDLSTEAQLHVLSRAVPLLDHAVRRLPDVSPDMALALKQGSEALARAIDVSVAAADANLTMLATLQAVAASLSRVATEDVSQAGQRIGDEASKLALRLETAGELRLAGAAARLAQAQS